MGGVLHAQKTMECANMATQANQEAELILLYFLLEI